MAGFAEAYMGYVDDDEVTEKAKGSHLLDLHKSLKTRKLAKSRQLRDPSYDFTFGANPEKQLVDKIKVMLDQEKRLPAIVALPEHPLSSQELETLEIVN